MDAFRINIEKLHVAFLTKDEPTGATHETPVLVAGTMQVQIKPKVSTGTLIGDGVIRHQEDMISGYDITLDHNKIPAKILSKMLGNDYVNHVRRSNASDVAVYFALGWRTVLSRGHSEMVWLPKCKLVPSDRSIQQKTPEGISYGTDSMNIVAMPLEYNKDFEYIGDTSDEDSQFTKPEADKWFEKVLVMVPKAAGA